LALADQNEILGRQNEDLVKLGIALDRVAGKLEELERKERKRKREEEIEVEREEWGGFEE